jgi:F1F0 ATPase subunit 2
MMQSILQGVPGDGSLLALMAWIAVWLAAGFIAGLVYFSVLLRGVNSLCQGGRVGRMVSLALLRLALMVGVLALAAWQGPVALLSVAFGFTVSRVIMINRIRATAS